MIPCFDCYLIKRHRNCFDPRGQIIRSLGYLLIQIRVNNYILLSPYYRFAELSACVFLNEGIPVWLYSQMVATPFVPFAISEKHLLAGVMVTASHNPKEDNGYKVYWSNGSQIITPHDKNIQLAILENLKWVYVTRSTRSVEWIICNDHYVYKFQTIGIFMELGPIDIPIIKGPLRRNVQIVLCKTFRKHSPRSTH